MRAIQELITKAFNDFKSLNNLDLNDERGDVIKTLTSIQENITKAKNMIEFKSDDFKIYLECIACGHTSVPVKNNYYREQPTTCEDCGANLSVRLFKKGTFRMVNLGKDKSWVTENYW